jgi:hypothetical protein
VAVYGVRRLTARQQTLAAQVCATARGLHDRLRELGQLRWDNKISSGDVTVVRGWLFDIHRDDPHEARHDLADVLDGARGTA